MNETEFLAEVRRLLGSSGDERVLQKALWVAASRYVNHAIEDAWRRSYPQAVARGEDCVIVTCDRETAISLTRKFVLEFAIARCCHYDGKTLSMYCGAAAPNVEGLMKRMRDIASGH